MIVGTIQRRKIRQQQQSKLSKAQLIFKCCRKQLETSITFSINLEKKRNRTLIGYAQHLKFINARAIHS
jgi:hypothetical protein